MAINHEQERAIGKLEEMLKFFRSTQIKNEESLFIINQQFDSFMSSLKYLPTEPSFDSFPPEIKTNILSYLCDAGAFVAASVSREWKEILKRRLKQLDQLEIGGHCSNKYECENSKCFMSEEMLKASSTHNLDIPLSVCHSLTDIDTQLIVEGLTSVSNLSITNDEDTDENFDELPLLPHQFVHLFEELEIKGKVMKGLELINVDLRHLNQDKLVNYLLSKVGELILNELFNGNMLDNELFIRTLLQNSLDSKLTRLTLLNNFEYPAEMSIDLADAVCKVENVKLKFVPSTNEVKTAKRLIENILTQNIRMKTLDVGEDIDWSDLISPEELKTIINKMDGLKLVGNFTVEQVEAAKSLPGIEANFDYISKSSI